MFRVVTGPRTCYLALCPRRANACPFDARLCRCLRYPQMLYAPDTRAAGADASAALWVREVTSHAISGAEHPPNRTALVPTAGGTSAGAGSKWYGDSQNWGSPAAFHWEHLRSELGCFCGMGAPPSPPLLNPNPCGPRLPPSDPPLLHPPTPPPSLAPPSSGPPSPQPPPPPPPPPPVPSHPLPSKGLDSPQHRSPSQTQARSDRRRPTRTTQHRPHGARHIRPPSPPPRALRRRCPAASASRPRAPRTRP